MPTAKCLDKYFELRAKEGDGKDPAEIDARLVAIVERMVDRCVLGEPCPRLQRWRGTWLRSGGSRQRKGAV
jgi:hypothetical protein